MSGESRKKVVEVIGDEQMMRLLSTRLLRCHSLTSVGKRVDGNPFISLPSQPARPPAMLWVTKQPYVPSRQARAVSPLLLWHSTPIIRPTSIPQSRRDGNHCVSLRDSEFVCLALSGWLAEPKFPRAGLCHFASKKKSDQTSVLGYCEKVLQSEISSSFIANTGLLDFRSWLVEALDLPNSSC